MHGSLTGVGWGVPVSRHSKETSRQRGQAVVPSDPRICWVERVQGVLPTPEWLPARTAQAPPARAGGDLKKMQGRKVSLRGDGRKPFVPTWHKWLLRTNGWVAIFELAYIPICLFIFLISHMVIMGAFL